MTPARQGEPERFPTTAWSLVARAGKEDARQRREALGQLLVRYLPALQAHPTQLDLADAVGGPVERSLA